MHFLQEFVVVVVVAVAVALALALAVDVDVVAVVILLFTLKVHFKDCFVHYFDRTISNVCMYVGIEFVNNKFT